MTSSLPAEHKALLVESTDEPIIVKTLPTPQPFHGSAVVKVLAADIISYHREIYNGQRHYGFLDIGLQPLAVEEELSENGREELSWTTAPTGPERQMWQPPTDSSGKAEISVKFVSLAFCTGSGAAVPLNTKVDKRRRCEYVTNSGSQITVAAPYHELILKSR